MNTKNIKAKAGAAKRSATVWFSTVVVPALTTGIWALQDQIPLLSGLLSGWKLVAFIFVMGTLTSMLRVRTVKHPEAPQFPVIEADHV